MFSLWNSVTISVKFPQATLSTGMWKKNPKLKSHNYLLSGDFQHICYSDLADNKNLFKNTKKLEELM